MTNFCLLKFHEITNRTWLFRMNFIEQKMTTAHYQNPLPPYSDRWTGRKLLLSGAKIFILPQFRSFFYEENKYFPSRCIIKLNLFQRSAMKTWTENMSWFARYNWILNDVSISHCHTKWSWNSKIVLLTCHLNDISCLK